MSKAEIIRKLQLYKSNPNLFKEVSPTELADLVLVVMGAVNAIDEAIKEGRHDGYTPQPDKDYLAIDTAKRLLKAEVDKMLSKSDVILSETSTELEKRVQQAIDNIRNGNDGIVTDEEIQRAAEIAYSLIELPDFDSLTEEKITSSPEAIRNSLELLPDGEKLSQEAIEGLVNELQAIKEAVDSAKKGAAGGVSRNTVLQLIAENGGGGSTVSVDGSEVSTPDFVSTGDVDFVATGSDITGDVKGLYGNPLDSTVGSPSDGSILVYRDAGNDWVLEAKPAGGSNPALNDVTDVTITSVADNEVLAYDSGTSTWINQTAAEAGLAAASHTHTASEITDFDTEVSNNTDVATNTAARHAAVTVTDSSEIDFTLTGQDITASLKAGSIDETKLDASVNASLDLADSASQPGHTHTESDITDLKNYEIKAVVSGSLTAVNDTFYVNVASATYTDPSPVEGEGFAVFVRNGTATVGGTGYSTAGTIVHRIYHSGAWSNYVYLNSAQLATTYQPLDSDLTTIAGLADPNADRILFWDDSAGAYAYLTASTGLTISGTNMTVRTTSSTQTGIVELATDAETVTGTDTARATTPANITAKMAAPGTIGGTTPGAATFTTVTTTGNIELGHASDTTISRTGAGAIAVEGVVVPTISSTNTFTNKRITKRTGTTTSSATPTINTDDVDEYYITAQAVDITSFTTNLSGTPTEGQTLFISIKGTAARAITWGASFGNGPVALPTTTVTTTQLSVFFKWNTTESKWLCYASGSTV